MIDILLPIIPKEWAAYGETLAYHHQPPADAVSIAELISNADLLSSILHGYAAYLGTTNDLRPVVSSWSQAYLQALLPPTVIAASVLKHVFPMRPPELFVQFSEHGKPLCFHIAAKGTLLPQADTAARYDSLLWQQLEPLFTQLSRKSRLPMKVLWGNTARQFESILTTLLKLSGDAADIEQDSQLLLHQPFWGSGSASRENPLYPRQRWISSGSSRDASTQPKIHRQCCLLYLLPSTGYCGACPLEAKD